MKPVCTSEEYMIQKCLKNTKITEFGKRKYVIKTDVPLDASKCMNMQLRIAGFYNKKKCCSLKIGATNGDMQLIKWDQSDLDNRP